MVSAWLVPLDVRIAKRDHDRADVRMLEFDRCAGAPAEALHQCLGVSCLVVALAVRFQCQHPEVIGYAGLDFFPAPIRAFGHRSSFRMRAAARVAFPQTQGNCRAREPWVGSRPPGNQPA